MNSLTSKFNKVLIQTSSTGAHFRRAFFSAGGPPSSEADKLKKWFERDKKSETLYRRLVFGNIADSHPPEFHFRSTPSESNTGVIKQKFFNDKSKRLHELLLHGIKHSEESSKVEMTAENGKDVLADATDSGENIPLPDDEAGRLTLLELYGNKRIIFYYFK